VAWYYEIHGLKEVVENLNREIEKIENRSLGGLIEGARIVWEDVERTEPTTPVDTGNLRNSRFTVTATGVPTGMRSEGAFKDNPKTKLKGSQMHAEHTAAITECQGIARASEGGRRGKFLLMGYSANYAAPVHENMEARHWTRQSPAPSGPKWFEYSLKRNTGKIVEAVRKNAMIKR
jgi:hypothetical protein